MIGVATAALIISIASALFALLAGGAAYRALRHDQAQTGTRLQRQPSPAWLEAREHAVDSNPAHKPCALHGYGDWTDQGLHRMALAAPMEDSCCPIVWRAKDLHQ
jgi:hypothetical protein